MSDPHSRGRPAQPAPWEALCAGRTCLPRNAVTDALLWVCDLPLRRVRKGRLSGL